MSYKSWLVEERPPQDFSETKGRYSYISSMYITLLETSVCVGYVCACVCTWGVSVHVYVCVYIRECLCH